MAAFTAMRKKKEAEEARAVDIKAEEQFLESQRDASQGLAGGVDPLELADAVAKLRRFRPAEQRRLLQGDWRLVVSDGSDLFIQLGSGLHGLPFVEVAKLYISIRTANNDFRTYEILKDVGPAKAVTTILKGQFEYEESELDCEYTGMVDANDAVTRQEREGETRKFSAQVLYTGERALVIRLAESDSRKGGFMVFERRRDLAQELLGVTNANIKVLTGGNGYVQ